MHTDSAKEIRVHRCTSVVPFPFFHLEMIHMQNRAVPLGLSPSFGFGDRLGLATPGHVASMRRAGKGIAPIYAQQSIREMTRTVRTPEQVMGDALRGASESGWTEPQGADA